MVLGAPNSSFRDTGSWLKEEQQILVCVKLEPVLRRAIKRLRISCLGRIHMIGGYDAGVGPAYRSREVSWRDGEWSFSWWCFGGLNKFIGYS